MPLEPDVPLGVPPLEPADPDAGETPEPDAPDDLCWPVDPVPPAEPDDSVVGDNPVPRVLAPAPTDELPAVRAESVDEPELDVPVPEFLAFELLPPAPLVPLWLFRSQPPKASPPVASAAATTMTNRLRMSVLLGKVPAKGNTKGNGKTFATARRTP